MQKYTLNPQSRLLHFSSPSCLESLPTCHALCCHQWDVGLLPSEYDSNRYQSETICSYDRKPCNGKVIDCIQRRYRLKKNPDASCIYLGDDSTCTIYAVRPKVCRDFSCAGGWQLSSVAAAPGAEPIPADASQSPYVGRLHGAVVLMINPLIALKTVFYAPDAKELALVTKPVSKCTVASLKTDLDVGLITDEQIMSVYSLFSSRIGMDDVIAKCAGFGVGREQVDRITMKLLALNLLVAVV